MNDCLSFAFLRKFLPLWSAPTLSHPAGISVPSFAVRSEGKVTSEEYVRFDVFMEGSVPMEHESRPDNLIGLILYSLNQKDCLAIKDLRACG